MKASNITQSFKIIQFVEICLSVGDASGSNGTRKHLNNHGNAVWQIRQFHLVCSTCCDCGHQPRSEMSIGT